ncbi:MAG: tetratricopeptide repeat protein [bacterium]
MEDLLSQMVQTALTIIGIAVAIFVPILIVLFSYNWNRNRKLRAYFDVIWKKGSRLTPEEVLDWRGKKEHGFRPQYHRRPEDDLIDGKLAAGQHLIVVGNPLAGKTRAVYEALRRRKKCSVTIPNLVDISLPDFHFPLRLAFWRPKVLLLDDIDKFVGKQNFNHLWREFSRRKVIIVATCRSGPEYERLGRLLEKELPIFGAPVAIGTMTKEKAQDAAKKLDASVPDAFDGNIGSLFVPLDTMRERFKEASTELQCILRSMRRMFLAGIWTGRQVFSLKRLKRVCEAREDLKAAGHQWHRYIDSLAGLNFLERVGDKEVRTEETYLETVIEDQFTPLDNLQQMTGIFTGDPEALYGIANRADDIAQVDLQKAAFSKVGTAALKSALEVWTIKENREKYARAQNALGIAYRTLADVEDKADNCLLAIAAYEQALRVYTNDNFPLGYAITQNNLGNAYWTLAEIENKDNNCQKAIAAFEQALRVFTYDDFPMQYAGTQNNLGAACSMLADIEDKADNCRLAIAAYEQALRVYTYDDFPMEYAATQNNLGNACGVLAEVEEKADNCRLAIVAFEKALRVFTYDDFPIHYATTQNNLGTAYQTLAEVEEKADNCRLAIAAYEQSLRVCTYDDFPMQYAMTQNNLGAAYQTLAEVEGKVDNCRKAIAAYEQALRVRTYDDFPMDYAMTQYNLGTAYQTLAVVEDKADNSRLAIAAFEQALRVYTYDDFPMQHADTQNNLGNAHQTLAEVEDKRENCRRARQAFDEALKVYTRDEFPESYAGVIHNLEILRAFCEGEAGGEGEA